MKLVVELMQEYVESVHTKRIHWISFVTDDSVSDDGRPSVDTGAGVLPGKSRVVWFIDGVEWRSWGEGFFGPTTTAFTSMKRILDEVFAEDSLRFGATRSFG